LGFLLGKYFTTERLAGERTRASELQDIYNLIEGHRNDSAEQVRSIYDEIKQHRDDNSRAGEDVWNKLREIEETYAH
jgi:hypothetical protein